MVQHSMSRRELFIALTAIPLPQLVPGPGLRDFFGRYAHCLAKQDAQSLSQLFATDAHYRDVTFGLRLVGRDAIRNMFSRTFAALTSTKYRTEHTAFDGDTIAVRWEMSGVHQGPLLGMPASGRRITFRGASFLRVQAQQVRDQVDYLDRAGLERALGVRGAARE